MQRRQRAPGAGGTAAAGAARWERRASAALGALLKGPPARLAGGTRFSSRSRQAAEPLSAFELRFMRRQEHAATCARSLGHAGRRHAYFMATRAEISRFRGADAPAGAHVVARCKDELIPMWCCNICQVPQRPQSLLRGPSSERDAPSRTWPLASHLSSIPHPHLAPFCPRPCLASRPVLLFLSARLRQSFRRPFC